MHVCTCGCTLTSQLLTFTCSKLMGVSLQKKYNIHVFVNMLLKIYIFVLFIKRVCKNENTVNNVYECSHASYQGSQSSSYIKNCHLHL